MSSVDTIVEIDVENTELRPDATRVCGVRHDFVEQGRATTSRLSREPLTRDGCTQYRYEYYGWHYFTQCRRMEVTTTLFNEACGSGPDGIVHVCERAVATVTPLAGQAERDGG